jgi:hypothetical protein
MQQVVGHERRVPVGEIVVESDPLVSVGGAGASLADPPGVGLRRDRVSQVLQRVEDVHRAMLDAVLVPRNQAPADSPVIRVLPGLVEKAGIPIETLDQFGADRRLLPQPDRCPDHQDVGGQHLLEHSWPLVGSPSMLGHVRPDTRRQVEVDRPQVLDCDSVVAHDADRLVHEKLRVRGLRRSLQRAVEEQRTQIAEVVRLVLVSLGHSSSSH